jgi:hypothetical protein
VQRLVFERLIENALVEIQADTGKSRKPFCVRDLRAEATRKACACVSGDLR